MPRAADSHHTGAAVASSSSTPSKAAPAPALRKGERYLEIRMDKPYTPPIPEAGTDEYRCFLMDPKLAKDTLITGTDFLPANPASSSTVILYLFARSPHATRAGTARVTAISRGVNCLAGQPLAEAAGHEGRPWPAWRRRGAAWR